MIPSQYKNLEKIFPHWVPYFYGAICAVLIPWTIFLAYLLPPKYISHNWDIAWTGFDIFMLFLFASTAVLAIRKSAYTAISSAMLATVILTDAWFDILTSRPGIAERRSILEAIFIELPLAIISFWLSQKIFQSTMKNKIIK